MKTGKKRRITQIKKTRGSLGRGGGGGGLFVCLLVGWLLNVLATYKLSQGRICLDNFTCCHTEVGVADQTFHLSHSILTPGQPVPALTL